LNYARTVAILCVSRRRGQPLPICREPALHKPPDSLATNRGGD